MPTDDSILDQVRRATADRLLPHRHTALLVTIIVLLAVRSLVGNTGAGIAMYNISVMLLLVVALYTIQVDEFLENRELLAHQQKKSSLGGWILAIITIVLRLSEIASPNHHLATASSIFMLLFFGFVTISELRSVLKHKVVTSETISMSISIYLLFGLTWGILYIVLFDFQPLAFSFGGAQAPSDQQINPILIYFSLTTLSTVGFGDITPVTLQARYAAVAEGIAGQFYLAILVARLVSMQMSQSASQPEEPHQQDRDTKRSAAQD
jgi:voltage-gated potassium channel